MNDRHRDQDFDTQQPLDSLASDPAFLAYAAGLDAEQDWANEIPMIEGLLSRRASGHCLTEVEVNAYRDRYQRLALTKLARAVPLPIVFEPYSPF